MLLPAYTPAVNGHLGGQLAEQGTEMPMVIVGDQVDRAQKDRRAIGGVPVGAAAALICAEIDVADLAPPMARLVLAVEHPATRQRIR
jgi:hypothetical protein